jgi:hypothetical protein
MRKIRKRTKALVARAKPKVTRCVRFMVEWISHAIGCEEPTQQMRCCLSGEDVRVVMFFINYLDSVNAIAGEKCVELSPVWR